MVGKGLAVTDDVYWKLVDFKFSGKYRSIDEVLRPMIGLPPGPHAHLKECECEGDIYVTTKIRIK